MKVLLIVCFLLIPCLQFFGKFGKAKTKIINKPPIQPKTIIQSPKVATTIIPTSPPSPPIVLVKNKLSGN